MPQIRQCAGTVTPSRRIAVSATSVVYRTFYPSGRWAGPTLQPNINSFSRSKIIPVHDRIESQNERALRLPPPEWADGEHDQMSLADRLVHHRRLVRQHLAALHDAGQQQVLIARRERHHNARTTGDRRRDSG